MNIYSIYRATNKINGKSYIGFDANWPNRKTDHKRDSKSSELIFHRAIRKHKWDNFKWEVIYQSKDGQHTLDVMESFFILENNSHVFSQNSNGYNMAAGGGGTLGMRHSTSTKKKIAASKKGKKYVPAEENCKFCLKAFAINQLPVHERSCIANPEKTPGYAFGKTVIGSIKQCCYCSREIRTTVLHKHEPTCDQNPNKVKLIYKSYSQRTSTCQYCGKCGGIGAMKRYHHANCKLVNTISY